jgi:hypothetical protein
VSVGMYPNRSSVVLLASGGLWWTCRVVSRDQLVEGDDACSDVDGDVSDSEIDTEVEDDPSEADPPEDERMSANGSDG